MSAITKLPAVEGLQRVKSGAVQFGDDWPGIFIRGDNAFHFAMTLRRVLEVGTDADPLATLACKGLADMLSECDLTGISRAANPTPTIAAEMTDEQLDEIAREHWHPSIYAGRDGQDFDHRAFARALLAAAPQSDEGLAMQVDAQKLRYDVLYEIAATFSLDYNAVCKVGNDYLSAADAAKRWVALMDSDWVNIVNNEEVRREQEAGNPDIAVNVAVRLTEERLRDLNCGGAHAPLKPGDLAARAAARSSKKGTPT